MPSVCVMLYFVSPYFIFLTIYFLCSFYVSYSFIYDFPSLSHILTLYGLNFFYPTFYVSFALCFLIFLLLR